MKYPNLRAINSAIVYTATYIEIWSMHFIGLLGKWGINIITVLGYTVTQINKSANV